MNIRLPLLEIPKSFESPNNHDVPKLRSEELVFNITNSSSPLLDYWNSNLSPVLFNFDNFTPYDSLSENVLSFAPLVINRTDDNFDVNLFDRARRLSLIHHFKFEPKSDLIDDKSYFLECDNDLLSSRKRIFFIIYALLY